MHKKQAQRKNLWSLLAVLSFLLCLGWGATATAQIDPCNPGWIFTVYDIDNEFFGHVTVVPDFWNEDVLVIEIFKEFKSPDFSEWGIGQALWIQCEKISETAPDTIIIQDERVTNSTGRDWYDFHIQLAGDLSDENQMIYFDAGYGFTPGGEGDPNPFSGFSYNYQYVEGQYQPLRADLNDGVQADGTTSQLGSPDPGDHLAIRTRGVEVGDVFWIKEYPTIPEPMTLGLLALGGLLINRRKA